MGSGNVNNVECGDVYPIAIAGKILVTVIVITGIGIVVLPIGILSSRFTEELRNKENEIDTCPKCG